MNKNLKDTISKKYKRALRYFDKDQSFEEKWLALFKDLINDLESRWDYNSIRYQTVMTKKEWQNFVNHPKRKPYQTKINFLKDFEDKFDFSLKIIKDSFSLYQQLNPGEFKNNLRSSIATLLDCALNAKYDLKSMRLTDQYYG